MVSVNEKLLNANLLQNNHKYNFQTNFLQELICLKPKVVIWGTVKISQEAVKN